MIQVLRRGSFITVADLMLADPSDVMRKCRIPLDQAKKLIDLVCRELRPAGRRLDDPSVELYIFTSGDAALDAALGGGIRAGMIWEVVGESAAGKTQLSLQLSLTVQLPRRLGGLSGSACVLLTSKTLYTNRLLEIIDTHPLLSPAVCGLSDIHAMKTTTIPELIRALAKELPAFCETTASRVNAKPVSLVIIDTLAELFHMDGKTSTTTLSQRSKDLAEISLLLHTLANKYNVAVLVLNEVSDSFEHPPLVDGSHPDDLVYRNQARFFNKADSVPGENHKEAALGLVWANQVNTRIMLSRTERTRYPEDVDTRPTKRRRLDGQSGPMSQRHADSQPVRIRRLTVIFSNIALPTSLDFMVTAEGITVIPDEDMPVSIPSVAQSSASNPPATSYDITTKDTNISDDTLPSSSAPQLPTFEALSSDDAPQPVSEGVDPENGPEPEDDEWEAYWKQADSMEDLYANIDLDTLSSSLPNTQHHS